MHYQEEPHEQGKLINCLSGSIYSVAVSLKEKTLGEWCGEIISSNNHKIMYIPRGYAHGYITMEDNSTIQYCVDNDFSKDHAKSLRYDDPDLGINWKINEICGRIPPIISDKDIKASRFKDVFEINR